MSSVRHRSSQKRPIVFLGGGRITSALIAGLRLANFDRPILVYDRNPHKLRALHREFHVAVARDLESALADAGVLILSVRPASVRNLLREISQLHTERPAVAVSLAAGVPLKNLRAGLGPPVRWARAMPSPVCRIGQGLTALAFSPEISNPQRKHVREFFSHVGPVLDIHETQFDAFTAAFSPSHGYHALANLAGAAQALGLDHTTALAAAAHALADGILYWRQSGDSLDVLLHEAATPGGTAAATMSAMDRAGYRRSVAAGLRAGIKRAMANAKAVTS